MEHADHIVNAISSTKRALGSIDGIITWIKLYLAIIVPLIAGTLLATFVLQLVARPILIGFLVSPDLGFTPNGIASMLQYLAGLVGVLCIFIFPFYQGYLCRTMRTKEVQGVTDSWGLFFLGWKFNALFLYYALPLVVISILYGIIFTFMNSALHIVAATDILGFTEPIYFVSLFCYIILEFVTFIFLSLFSFLGFVHLARTSSLRESINMRKIADIIRRIGIYNYILAIVIILILFLMLVVIFMGLASLFDFALAACITFFVLFLFFIIPFGIFATQYIVRVYDASLIDETEDIEEFDNF